MKAARFPLALVALSALTACEAPTRQRSPIPTAPSPPAPSSQIIVQSMSPSAGATLPVDKCRYYPSSFNLDFWEMCADGLSLRFDVEFEADVTNAIVTAGFYSGSQRCGLATSQTAPLAAGSRTAFEATVILLSDESVPLRCAFPAETSRMVVQLWERSRAATPLVTREFAHSYRFSQQ
jgi:hypothetical protein